MTTLALPLNEWLPDQPALNNPGLTRAHNVIPGAGKFYRPFPGAEPYADTSLPSRPYAAISLLNNNGNARVFCASKLSLWSQQPDTRAWADASRTGGYTTSDLEGWRFTEAYGLNIATNYSDHPQFINTAGGTKFANLTSLVKGRYVATLRDFVLLGNTFDSFDGAVPYRVRWSAIGNPNDWNFSATTQSDFQDILGGGAVQAVIGGEEGTILLKTQIVKMVYVGSPAIFEFRTIYQNKGCAIPQSVITADGKIFFYAEDGFYQLENDRLTAIGKGKVDHWFATNSNQAAYNRMSVSIDPLNKLVIWLFASADATNLTPDTLLIYNYDTGAWSTASSPTTFLFNALSLPITLAALDRHGSLAAVPASLDSPVWTGGRAFLAGMDDRGKVFSFSAAALPAVLETGEYQTAQQIAAVSPDPVTADRALVRSVSPKVHGPGDVSVAVAGRVTPQAMTMYGAAVSMNANGWCPQRNDSRYHRYRVSLSGGWSQVMGVEIDAVPTGRR
ncbi:UNVERIFIED_ORG: hypothetical protein M2438_002488 [Methylobacterium sp. SuP10 SLI 274]|uniref:hypothetical protein n=1 Tax=Methylorubrum extorquens TaxID=408 RepID=UPI0020A0C2DC|nr:hypothetical protein [Methylorubrum extorquens]MCP1558404.1 hypothetical protein [Methylorubrum extorquens]MDF9863712.1 hypothetical protein [Methylorubrum pseudosasae]MDH6637313.1 hypothetical protein [Methylobacterium sp. SuP10 SLI 274]MDH6666492.1 hypothetical protein [Methylorubrum zatmanii]